MKFLRLLGSSLSGLLKRCGLNESLDWMQWDRGKLGTLSSWRRIGGGSCPTVWNFLTERFSAPFPFDLVLYFGRASGFFSQDLVFDLKVVKDKRRERSFLLSLFFSGRLTWFSSLFHLENLPLESLHLWLGGSDFPVNPILQHSLPLFWSFGDDFFEGWPRKGSVLLVTDTARVL